MKTKKVYYLLPFWALGLFTLHLTSCQGGEDTEKNKVEIDNDSTEVSEADVVEYSVPTPNELFEIISLFGGDYNPGLINPAENAANYVDTKTKALNFGVYSADLAYMSSFDKIAEALEYFKLIEKLGEELGISAAFDESVVNRIQDNQGNADSVFAISSDTYYNAYKYLEENEKGNILALILAGGWIESMYIITHLTDKFEADSPIMDRIADQKLVFDNLLGFISNYSDNKSVEEVLDLLVSFLDVFEMFDAIEEDTSVDRKESGEYVLGGGVTYKVNEASFNALKAKAAEVRGTVVN